MCVCVCVPTVQLMYPLCACGYVPEFFIRGNIPREDQKLQQCEFLLCDYQAEYIILALFGLFLLFLWIPLLHVEL